MDIVTDYTRDMLCEMHRMEFDGHRSGTFLVLNVEERAERREYLRDLYEREGKTGPQCHQCTLPVID